jgi:tRNA(Ile)-lysidine synthetase-like protein
VRKVYKDLIFSRKPGLPATKGVFPLSTGQNRLEPFMLSLDISESGEKPLWFPSDPYTAFFDRDKMGDLHVRTFREGDRFYPLGMTKSVKLKDFFISHKVPREKRRHIPLLLSERDIVWVIGYRIDERYKIEAHSRNILKVVARAGQ